MGSETFFGRSFCDFSHFFDVEFVLFIYGGSAFASFVWWFGAKKWVHRILFFGKYRIGIFE